MMLTAMIGAMSLVAMGPTAVTNVRQMAETIEIRSGMFDGAQDLRRDQIRFRSTPEPTAVVGSISNGVTSWDQAGSDREALGGEDAPELIMVRAFDAVFAIDPFVELPKGDITASRQLINGTSLETDRALLGRRRIERTEELMEVLEHARRAWLRDNGFYGVQTIRNPNHAEVQEGASLPEPAGWFRVPDEMPRGNTSEQVQAEPTSRGAAIAASILSGDEPIRISLPFGTAPDVVASVEHRNSQSESQDGEVASR